MHLSDRTVLALLLALVCAAVAAVWVPLERRYADDPVEKARRGEVTGLHELSLLRAGNARRAVEAVRRRLPPEVRVQNLALRPATLFMTVVEPANGSRQDFAVDAGFAVTADDRTDATTDDGVPFRRIDAGIPERMARTVLARVHRDDDALDYAVLASSIDGRPQWVLFLKGGPIRDRAWRASGDGSDVRRNGT